MIEPRPPALEPPTTRGAPGAVQGQGGGLGDAVMGLLNGILGGN